MRACLQNSMSHERTLAYWLENLSITWKGYFVLVLSAPSCWTYYKTFYVCESNRPVLEEFGELVNWTLIGHWFDVMLRLVLTTLSVIVYANGWVLVLIWPDFNNLRIIFQYFSILSIRKIPFFNVSMIPCRFTVILYVLPTWISF